jgi:hypothetical protein
MPDRSVQKAALMPRWIVGRAGVRTVERCAVLWWVALLACGSPCEENNVVTRGKRFKVTVLEDVRECEDTLVLVPNDTFVVTAGETHRSNTSGCEYTVGAGTPELPPNTLVINSCMPDEMPLGTQCHVALNDCGSGAARFFPHEIPVGSSPLQTQFDIWFRAGQNSCIRDCRAIFAVTIEPT